MDRLVIFQEGGDRRTRESIDKPNAGVAQQVEQRTRNAWGSGSTPLTSSRAPTTVDSRSDIEFQPADDDSQGLVRLGGHRNPRTTERSHHELTRRGIERGIPAC